MKKISLDGRWKLTYFQEGKFKIENPAQFSDIKTKTMTALVPGNVELDLVRAGEIPDPFFADNVFKLRPYEFYEWWYERSFEIPPFDSRLYPHRYLVFHGIDCFSEIWLNGHKLGETDNMFVEHRFEITSLLRPGRNKLAVRIKSPINEARKYEYDASVRSLPVNQEQLYVRKAPHMYGWDICPRIVSAGIWRSVEIELHRADEIADIYYFTKALHGNAAELGIFWNFRTENKDIEGFSMRFTGKCGKSIFEKTIPLHFISGREIIHVPEANLWWPRGYGKANLYSVKAELLKNGKIVDSRTDETGIRKIELVRTDVTTVEQPGEFLFKCNGVPIMCKGSNWVPADAFHSRDASRYEKILVLFDDLGCNVIRCWGGNVYEDHKFYGLCDRKGIMVWQDFAFACARYPQNEEFLNKVRVEAEKVVKKLRNHACIILWSGDNECDYLFFEDGVSPSKNRITREVLPRVVVKNDIHRPYLPSSPYMSEEAFKMRTFDVTPEQHLWGPRDYYKSKFYTQSLAHFASEIGYHGCPNVSSIKKFIDKKHLWHWKDNTQWRTHCTDPVPGGSGYSYRVSLMAKQIKELFGFDPKNLNDFALASQVSQAEAKKFFIESFRIKKWRRTGIIWWNVIDCWPQFSDAIVDYYFSRKLAYWYIKRVQQPFCIMMDEPENQNCRVVAGNDSLKPVKGKYSIRDADSGGAVLGGNFEVDVNISRELGRIRTDRGEQKLFLITWEINNKEYGNHYLLGSPPISFMRYKKWLRKIASLPFSFDADKISK